MKNKCFSLALILTIALTVFLVTPVRVSADNNGVVVTVPKTEGERLMLRIKADSDALLKKLNESVFRAGIAFYFNMDNTAEVAEVSGPAKKSGLKEGDKILSVDGESLTSADEYIDKVQRGGKSARTATLLVESGGIRKNIVVATAEFKVQGKDKPKAAELQKEIEEEAPKFIADIKDIIENGKDTKELIGIYLSYSMWIFSISDEVNNLVQASE